MSGNLEEAIDLTYQLFPGILERNKNLLFALKVRQFIEMINNANILNNSMDDTIVTENNQENQNLSCMNISNNSKNLTNTNETFMINNKNSVENKISETTNTRLLTKNGFSNHENSIETLKSNENINVPSEEAMGK